jgi:patatin-like phospholipase/acyl hydrolase
LDGGGIRGIFAAAVLAELERRHLGGRPITAYFDLIAGTSTGGIIALGLGAGMSAAQLADLYVTRGNEVFPPSMGRLAQLRAWARSQWHLLSHLYDREALTRLLDQTLGDRLFGQSCTRLCIPAFEGLHSEVFVFKTPHHPDYKTDRFQRMTTVGLATSAAPTYFRPLQQGGYTLVDGGVWANNPIMLAVIEAMTCYNVTRDQIQVLSIGCGEDRYVLSHAEIVHGGIWHWRRVMLAAMRLQSLAATNQARLLLGPPQVIRIAPPELQPSIKLDDWQRSVRELLPIASERLAMHEQKICELLLAAPSEPFQPVAFPEQPPQGSDRRQRRRPSAGFVAGRWR